MSPTTPSDLLQQVADNLPNNSAHAITAQKLRTVFNSIISSAFFPLSTDTLSVDHLFPEFVETDHPYAAGDGFRYQMPGDANPSLFIVKSATNSTNPLPTSSQAPYYRLTGTVSITNITNPPPVYYPPSGNYLPENYVSEAIGFIRIGWDNQQSEFVRIEDVDNLVECLKKFKDVDADVVFHLMRPIRLNQELRLYTSGRLFVEGNGHTITVESGTTLFMGVDGDVPAVDARFANLHITCEPDAHCEINYVATPLYVTGCQWEGVTFQETHNAYLSDTIICSASPAEGEEQLPHTTLWLSGSSQVCEQTRTTTVVVDNSVSTGTLDTVYEADLAWSETLDLTAQSSSRRVLLRNNGPAVRSILNGDNPLLYVYAAPDSSSPMLESNGNILLCNPPEPIPADGKSFILLSRQPDADKSGLFTYRELYRCFYKS